MKGWASFLLAALAVLCHYSHARQTNQYFISDSNLLKPFVNQLFEWRRNRIPSHHGNLPIGLHTILAGVLCFGAAAISSAGGLGGGGVYLPILSIVAGLELKTAAAFTAFMVAGASVANVMSHLFCPIAPNLVGNKHLIDYDIALLSEPCMLLGVSVGVICNTVFPDWLITLLFVIFLAYSTFKTWRCGFSYWRSESNAEKIRKEVIEVGNGDSGNDGLGGGDGGRVIVQDDPLLGEEMKREPAIPWKKLGILVIVWVCFFALHVVRGDRDGQDCYMGGSQAHLHVLAHEVHAALDHVLSVLGIKACGAGYWIVSSLQIPLAVVFTAFVLYQKDSPHSPSNQREAATPPRIEPWSKVVFPVMALLSGVLGGLFGIGGGMLINPVLLQMGIPPQITAATSSFMVLFSSSMSSVQYLLLGMKHVDEALIFAAVCFVASLVGLALVQRAITRYGRVSLIVFSVATVLALSTLLITAYGMVDLWREYESGQYMGFKSPC
ncbi:hypothetical protein ACLOJK_039624 [Asimina triloba]